MRCFVTGGAAVDTPFVNTFENSSLNAVNTITRSGVGTYQVRLGRKLASEAYVQVTAVGATPDGCKPVNWTVTGGGPVVNVRCQTSGGAFTDSQFLLQHTD